MRPCAVHARPVTLPAAQVRRGLPLQDLTGKRGFPDDGMPEKGSGGPLDPAAQPAPPKRRPVAAQVRTHAERLQRGAYVTALLCTPPRDAASRTSVRLS